MIPASEGSTESSPSEANVAANEAIATSFEIVTSGSPSTECSARVSRVATTLDAVSTSERTAYARALSSGSAVAALATRQKANAAAQLDLEKWLSISFFASALMNVLLRRSLIRR